MKGTENFFVILRNREATSATPEPKPGCRGIIRQAFRVMLEETAEIMMASIAENSTKQYRSAILEGKKYCRYRYYKIDHLNTSVLTSHFKIFENYFKYNQG